MVQTKYSLQSFKKCNKLTIWVYKRLSTIWVIQICDTLIKRLLQTQNCNKLTIC
ncbi:hypothetical protein HanIR_Chr03g0119901 [Helianthus annuus]|nr:hypothetical protein HanIR_Chr03g0119901 [Helianthus annuus]